MMNGDRFSKIFDSFRLNLFRLLTPNKTLFFVFALCASAAYTLSPCHNVELKNISTGVYVLLGMSIIIIIAHLEITPTLFFKFIAMGSMGAFLVSVLYPHLVVWWGGVKTHKIPEQIMSKLSQDLQIELEPYFVSMTQCEPYVTGGGVKFVILLCVGAVIWCMWGNKNYVAYHHRVSINSIEDEGEQNSSFKKDIEKYF